MIHKYNHPFQPLTAVCALYDRLSDSAWHSTADLFAMIGVKKPRSR